MKKLIICLTLVFAFMLTSCDFIHHSSTGEITIENNTKIKFYCMANYNSSLTVDDKPWILYPGTTEELTLKGFDYEDENCFIFYYLSEDEFASVKIKDSAVADDEWFLMHEYGDEVDAIDVNSKKFKVVINPTDGNNYSVKLTW